GGVILDINRMRDIKVVDEARRRVRIGAGATWGEVAEVLAPRGWAISSGDAGGVGVGGLGTTGGIGYLGRLQGLTIDHVVAAEVVTADGSVVHASAEQNPDLFWALRGAGATWAWSPGWRSRQARSVTSSTRRWCSTPVTRRDCCRGGEPPWRRPPAGSHRS